MREKKNLHWFDKKWEVYYPGNVIPDIVMSVHYTYGAAKKEADRRNWSRYLKGDNYEDFAVYLVRRR